MSSWILDSIIESISVRLNKQLHIDKDIILLALKDETFELKKEEEKKNELNSDIYIYNFYDNMYKQNKDEWKFKNIKLDDGLYYKLDLTTNLIYSIDKNDNYTLVGMKNKNNECMDVDELDPIIFKWCYLQSIEI